jgi:hypothetical protein
VMKTCSTPTATPVRVDYLVDDFTMIYGPDYAG